MNDPPDPQRRRQRTVDSNATHHNNNNGGRRRRHHNHRHRGGGRGGQNFEGGGQRFVGDGGVSEETTSRRGPGDNDRGSVVGYTLERPQEHQYDSFQRHGQRHNGGSRGGRGNSRGRANSRFKGGHSRSRQNGGGRGGQMQQPMTTNAIRMTRTFSSLSLKNTASSQKDRPSLQSAPTDESPSSSSSANDSAAASKNLSRLHRIQSELFPLSKMPATKTAVAMTPHKTETVTVNYPPTTPTPFNIDFAKAKWSADRVKQKRSKYRHLNFYARPVVGGDTLVDKYNDQFTLAFPFYRGTEKFGLTVGHLDDVELGDKVSMFIGRDQNGLLVKDYVGRVVQLGESTDSLVFQFFDEVQIDHLAVALYGGGGTSAVDCTVHHINLEKADRLRLKKGDDIMAFGSSRRGMTGVFLELIGANNQEGDASHGHLRNMRAISFDDEGVAKKPFTDKGDCGAIYLDKDGFPVAMHVTLKGRPNPNPTQYFSVAIPLRRIIDDYPDYFKGWRGKATDFVELQSSPSCTNFMTKISLVEDEPVPTEKWVWGPRAQAENRPEQDCFYDNQLLNLKDTGLKFVLGPRTMKWIEQQKQKAESNSA